MSSTGVASLSVDESFQPRWYMPIHIVELNEAGSSRLRKTTQTLLGSFGAEFFRFLADRGVFANIEAERVDPLF